jgi:hypothetical protein
MSKGKSAGQSLKLRSTLHTFPFELGKYALITLLADVVLMHLVCARRWTQKNGPELGELFFAKITCGFNGHDEILKIKKEKSKNTV